MTYILAEQAADALAQLLADDGVCVFRKPDSLLTSRVIFTWSILLGRQGVCSIVSANAMAPKSGSQTNLEVDYVISYRFADLSMRAGPLIKTAVADRFIRQSNGSCGVREAHTEPDKNWTADRGSQWRQPFPTCLR